jgi:hypothetical protein
LKTKYILLIILVIAVSVYGSWLYFTQFYYRAPQYTVGVRNSTVHDLRDVLEKLSPEGENPAGSLVAGQEKRHMTPPWPLPEEIQVSFTDDRGKPYQLPIVTGLAKDYRGALTVIITETNGNYSVSLEK